MLNARITDFFSIDLGTIIPTLLNTIILFLILKHFLFGRVNKVLEDRKSAVAKTYGDADAALENAQKLETEYSQKLEKAKEESAEILKNAAKKAQQRSDEIIDEAKSEASAIMAKAGSEIEREKKRALNQVKDEITDIAYNMAAKVVGREVSEADSDRLIEEFIDNVGK